MTRASAAMPQLGRAPLALRAQTAGGLEYIMLVGGAKDALLSE